MTDFFAPLRPRSRAARMIFCAAAWLAISITSSALAEQPAKPAAKPAATTQAQAPANAGKAAPAQPPAPAAAGPNTSPVSAASLDAAKAALAEIEQALAADPSFDESLADLKRRLIPMRSDFRDMIETLERDVNEVIAQLKQLGDPPGDDDPKEDPGIAAERARLDKHQNDLDAALKQMRLLAQRADDASVKVTDLRRGLFARELFARSSSLFGQTFWHEVWDGIPAEAARAGQLLRAWGVYTTTNASKGAWVGAALTLAGFALAAVLLFRWLHSRLLDENGAARFSRAGQAVLVMLANGLAMPMAVLVGVLVLESYGMMPAWIRSIGMGLALAVAAASGGRAVALALFAPGQPDRRLLCWTEQEASLLTSHLVWASRALGLTIFLNLIHKTTTAPVALTVLTSAAFSLVLVALATHFLWRTAKVVAERARDEGTAVTYGPGLRVVRVLLGLSVAVMAAALVIGYVGLAAFVGGRLVILFAIIGALVVADTFVDSFFSHALTSDSPRGRAAAALLGLSHRGLDLVSTLLSAVTRLAMLIFAVLAVIGPWGVFADDMLARFAESAFGWQVGGVTISVQTILGAIALLLVGILAVRGAQRWLQSSFLPRTALDPGLQHSISALFGYAGLIAVLAAVMGAIGIDLQKIALIAGALSVGIGFGLQSIVSNFVSGLILLAERPIRVGDWVVVKGDEGFVRRISVRATEIETFERASVIIPNSEFITGVVKNWTHANTLGRVTVKVKVAFDSDVDQVREVLLSCAREHPLVLKTPPPSVYLLGFADIGLDMELRCILANVENGLSVKSDLHVAVLRRFRENRIRISFPGHQAEVPGPPVEILERSEAVEPTPLKKGKVS